MSEACQSRRDWVSIILSLCSLVLLTCGMLHMVDERWERATVDALFAIAFILMNIERQR